MIKQLFNQLADALKDPSTSADAAESRQSALRTATAVLMLDVALADKTVDEREVSRILELVKARFDLAKDDAADLIETARGSAEEMVSLHEFTDTLHKHMSEAEKTQVMSLLWDIAYADGELNKYEDALILKIGDLLYVDRVRVMRAKDDAKNKSRGL